MKTIVILCLLFSLTASAVTESHQRMKPNKDYMSYFLEGYIKWFEDHFSVSMKRGDPEFNKFIKEVIINIDHWKVPNSVMDQVLFGLKVKNNVKVFSFRLYISQNLKDLPYLKSLEKLPYSPMFVEWNSSGELCFIVKQVQASGEGLSHYCQNSDGEELTHTGITTIHRDHTFTWKTPFPGQSEYEVRTYENDILKRIFYYVRYTHIGKIQPPYHNFINSHGEKALLPFDKFSIDSEGDLTVYYP